MCNNSIIHVGTSGITLHYYFDHRVQNVWGSIYPQTTVFAAISEPPGISGRALTTYPENELDIGRRCQALFGTYQ